MSPLESPHLEEAENARPTSLCIPIATFAPEPFEIVGNVNVIVRPEEDSFVATLFDANVSSSGDTPEEAVANVKDLSLMIFQSLEGVEDQKLGPAMIRQKHVLRNFIRRT